MTASVGYLSRPSLSPGPSSWSRIPGIARIPACEGIAYTRMALRMNLSAIASHRYPLDEHPFHSLPFRWEFLIPTRISVRLLGQLLLRAAPVSSKPATPLVRAEVQWPQTSARQAGRCRIVSSPSVESDRSPLPGQERFQPPSKPFRDRRRSLGRLTFGPQATA